MNRTKKITKSEAKSRLYWIDLPKRDYCDCGSLDGCVECNPAEQDPKIVKEIKMLKKIIGGKNAKR